MQIKLINEYCYLSYRQEQVYIKCHCLHAGRLGIILKIVLPQSALVPALHYPVPRTVNSLFNTMIARQTITNQKQRNANT